jgi:hypothetical protein
MVSGAAGLLFVALIASACSSQSKPPVPTATTAAPPSTVLVPTAGLPAFYAVPSPLPHAPAGTLLRAERVQGLGVHGAMFRVMYLSTTALGAPVAVTGLVAVPGAPAPASGYPVVSWAHGTTGMAPRCAPSLDPNGVEGTLALANLVLDRGWEFVATDYQGEGTPGPLPYLVGSTAAHDAIDIVRAAHHLPAAHASSTYAVWGHSEGGHSALFALALGLAYAPELRLVGVVAGAPPSQFRLFYTALHGSPDRYYVLMIEGGFNAAYGDARAPLDQVLTPLGVSLVPELEKGCEGDVMKAVDQYSFDQVFRADAVTRPGWNELVDENDPAMFATAVPVPLLIPQGGNDTTIPPLTTQLLTQQLCRVGQHVTRWVYPGFGHADVVPAYIGDVERWLADRFDGAPAPDPVTPTGAREVAVTTCP